MKKMILLCTMICAGQLYGIDLDQKIALIKNMSAFKNANLRDFTVIVSGLTMPYPDVSREEIAIKFNAPIAQQYLRVNRNFVGAIGQDMEKNKLEQLEIDPNFTVNRRNNLGGVIEWGSTLGEASVKLAQGLTSKNTVEFLIQNKANPNLKEGKAVSMYPTRRFGTILDWARERAKQGDDNGLLKLLETSKLAK